MALSMFTTQTLFEGHIPKDRRIGIGWNGSSDKVARSTDKFGDMLVIYNDPQRLVDDLFEGKIDAALRGDMSSSVLLPILKKRFSVDALERVVFLQPKGGKLILSAPVGIDEGWTVEQKHNLVVRSVGLAEAIGMGTKVAIMSGGRKDDTGRCKEVDRTIYDALELVDILKKEGYDAYHAEILIEDAVKDADIIIAPDGISGNLIFRTLHLIGGAEACGAPVVNIDKIFVDTSRAKNDYSDAIALALRLTEGKK